jgi:ubiquinone/menaquinone biosynthesis C-methylase UbiE
VKASDVAAFLGVSSLRDATAPYSAAEAFFYDKLVAPALLELKEATLAEFLPRVAKGAEVLEVGCGGGQLACELCERRPDVRYIGLDLSPDQVRRASRRGARFAPRLSFVRGSALDLPFDTGRFDLVLSIASIKHWPDPARGLAECVRVAKSGGSLLIVEADRGCRLEDAKRFVARWRVLPPLRPLFLAMFRTLVAGRSIDLDDARELCRPLPFAELEVRRIENTPALIVVGTRR